VTYVGESATVLAVDIGGTKLAVGIVDEHGDLLDRAREATPVTCSADELFGVLGGLIDDVLDRTPSRPVVVGVGCGGPMGAGGVTVSPLNIKAWRDFPLRDALVAHTGLAVFVDNDAKAFALAEGWRGAAQGVDDYIGMVVSTGIGGGIVLGGRLLDGATGNAGHIGHVVVCPDGHVLADHVQGVLEGEASGTAIADRTGRPAIEADHEERVRAGRLVGRAVGSVANLLDLRLAVVGGSVALGFGLPFFTAAQTEIDRVAQLDHSTGTRIVPAGLGDRAPLIGAAAVGWKGLGER